jgi:hypothetical protein
MSNSFALFLGIAPLFIFVLIDSFFGLKAGLVAALLVAIAEAILSLVLFKTLDFVTLITLFSVIVFVIISYKKQSPLWLKLQPSVMGIIIGIIFIGSFIIDRPILFEMAIKYQEYLPLQMQQNLEHVGMRALLIYGTFSMGVGHFLHAGLCALAAFKMNNWWWIVVRSIGYYVILFICMMLTNIYLVFKFNS